MASRGFAYLSLGMYGLARTQEYYSVVISARPRPRPYATDNVVGFLTHTTDLLNVALEFTCIVMILLSQYVRIYTATHVRLSYMRADAGRLQVE